LTITFKVEDIEKNYHAVKALNGITLNMQGGSIVVLIGVNGAGKTTLLRIIAGLEAPDKGKIVLNGENISAEELRKVATLVFQKTAMFSMNVHDNLAFGLRIRKMPKAEIDQKVSQALASVGLANFENRKAKKTSGGEQQRISLARAFLLEPKILLLDEPTANLDPNSATIIERAIVSRKKPDTVIIISTHNLNQARRLGDEVVHIHGGRIVDHSSPEEFFDSPKSEITRKFINGDLEF
jgi:tungstate transport system ATP-binding protein